MIRRIAGWFLIGIVIVTFCCRSILRAEVADSVLGQQIDNFELKDFRGRAVTLGSIERELVVVAFLGTECPLAKLYGPRLQEMSEQFPRVQFLGVNSNRQDNISEIAHFVREHQLAFPHLKDTGNRLADRFQAKRTPEVFVLDRERRVRYRGRIDDQYGVGYTRDAPQRDDLRIALKELLAGKPVAVAQTESVGCHIGRIVDPDESSPVTFGGQIAKILHKHCVECHRTGDIAPFALTDYDEVLGWAETIAEVVRDQRMPPWHANPKFGHFANERLMTSDEKEMVYRWVKAGAPRGDLTNVPSLPETARQWHLPRTPDQVVPMRARPFVVPAGQTVDYQYFVIDPGFDEDKWVSAAEVLPGERAVVHHALVFFRPPESHEQQGIGWLGAYVPGQGMSLLPPQHARRIPAGSKLIFQMHYTPNGTVQEDLTRIGLLFTEESQVEWEVVSLLAINHHFEIPPFADNYRVETSVSRFPHKSHLLAVAPHMHLRGRSFRFVVHDSAGETVLLDVPHYDFNWQHGYQLLQPLELTSDMRIDCIAHFDNSEGNLVNPDPSAKVRWGDQSWEEMMLAYFDVAMPIGTKAKSAVRTISEAQERRANQLALNLMKRFDLNDDGFVRRDEVPDSFGVFAFRRLDLNRDGAITLQEASEEARDSQRRRASSSRSGRSS